MIDLLWRRFTDKIDGPLFSIALTILMLGMLTLYSAAYETPNRIGAQLANIAFAMVVMWVAAQIPPQTLMRLAPPLYIMAVMLLIAVALFGDIRNGARRWLNLGFISIQPSEIMKIAMPLMLAWYFHKYEAMLRHPDLPDSPPTRPWDGPAGGRIGFLCHFSRWTVLENHHRHGHCRNSQHAPAVVDVA